MQEEGQNVEAEYRRDIDGNYLVIYGEAFREQEYPLRMLANNHPECFLRLRLSGLNGRTVLMYEVTSLQPVSRIFERTGVREEQMRLTLEALDGVLKDAGRYLLNPADIVLDPDCIFYEQNSRRALFIYVPGYGEEHEDQLKGLAEFLLRHLDHKDEKAVRIGYAFYDKCSDKSASLYRILEELSVPEYIEVSETGREESGTARKSEKSREWDREPAMSLGEGGKEDRKRESHSAAGRKSSTAKERRHKDGRAVEAEKGQKDRDDPSIPRKKVLQRWRKAAVDRRKDIRSLAMILGCSLACSIAFALIVWLGKLDIVQTGGLFFGMIALVWLIYRLTIGKRKENQSVWEDDLDDPDEEEAFLQALMSDVYSRGPGRRIQVFDMEGEDINGNNMYWDNKAGNSMTGNNKAGNGMAGNNVAGNSMAGNNKAGNSMPGNNMGGSKMAGNNMFGSRTAGNNMFGSRMAGNDMPGNSMAGYNMNRNNTDSNSPEYNAGSYLFAGMYEDGTRGAMGEVSEAAASGEVTFGSTRVLGVCHTDRQLRLISEDIRRCKDLSIESGTVRIGKSPDLVDLCIPLDVISRVHAQIRQTQEGAFLQDLNSTNGTFINGQMLEPSQEQAIQDGDIVAFAGVRFTVCFKDM